MIFDTKNTDKSLNGIESIFLKARNTAGNEDSVLTCYFYNPEIDIYWPILQLGDLEYPHLVLGPISNLRYNPRLTDEKIKCYYKEVEKSEFLTHKNFDGIPFVVREGIKSAIRLRYSDEEGFCVVIFVGYRIQKSEVELVHQTDEYYHKLEHSFGEIRAKFQSPIIDHAETSKRLRNITSSGLFNFASPLIKKESEVSEKEFWKNLSTKLASLFEERIKLTVCQIYEVFQDGELEIREGQHNPFIKGGHKYKVCKNRDVDSGIVEFVARTGRCVQIDDIKKYEEKYRIEQSLNAPKYNKCCDNSKSELCYPVVSSGKILGVINLESSDVGCFKVMDIFVLHHISSLISVAIKSYSSARSLREVNRFINNALKLESREEVFDSAVSCIKNDFSYLDASLWDTKTAQWFDHDESHSGSIRENGLTNEIIKKNYPIIVVDFKTISEYGGVYSGQLYDDCMFKEWNLDRLENCIPNEYLSYHLNRHLKNKGAQHEGREPRYLCDIGFPITSTVSRGQDGVKSEVIAVMWVKCSRPYSSITSEDFWFLSLVCRRVADNLIRIKYVEDKVEISLKSQINKHLGSSACNVNIRKLFLEDRDSLKYHKSEDVIILNMDIRGSSAFCEMCTQSRNVKDAFHEFIGLYQGMVRKSITENHGIFDKTVGDGVVGIFNVFTRDGVRYTDLESISEREENLNIAKKDAMNAAITICKKFMSEVLYEFVVKYKKIIPPYDLKMGGALVLSSRHSECFVGSGTVANSVDFDIVEFSAYGDVANVAGKLCDYARHDVIISATESLKSKKQSAPEYYKPIGKSKSELLRDIAEITQTPHDIILCSSSFDETVKSIQKDSQKNRIKFSCDLVPPRKVQIPSMMGNLIHMVAVDSESLTSVLDRSYLTE